MADRKADLARLFVLREAVASVSLSHDEDCRCTTCRAALGDEEAMAEIMAALPELDGNAS